MKKLLLLSAILTMLSCREQIIEKPEKLIDETTMKDIIYDLAVLEAIKTQKPLALAKNKINPRTYIYSKYGIDSLQFARNNAWYASDIDKYKAMYEAVGRRLEKRKKEADSLVKASGGKTVVNDPEAPMVR